MSIFNFFSQKSLSAEDKKRAASAIEAYRAEVERDLVAHRNHVNNQTVEALKYYLSEERLKALGESRRFVLTLLDEMRQYGRDVLTERCVFYTIAVGDSDWISNDRNRERIACDFAALKRRSREMYEEMRLCYWDFFLQRWGNWDGSKWSFQSDFFAYPGRIFPDGHDELGWPKPM